MRKGKSSIWAVMALLVVGSMLLASCGGAPATQAPPVATEAPAQAATGAPTQAATEPAVDRNYSPDIPDPTEPVTIAFANFNDMESTYWQNLKTEFEAIHPNIKIEYQVVPGEEMFDKLLAQIAAGNPPDAAYVSDWMTGSLAQNEGLVPLDDFIAKSKSIDLADYVPAFLGTSQVGGVQYGIPMASETTGLFYRTDRFEEVGLDPNHPPETWDELTEYAEKLTDTANSKYGFVVFAPESAYYFYPWLWQAGATQLNPDDPMDVTWDSEAGQRAANFYVNLAKYSPKDLLNATSWDGRVSFANGDVGMMVAGAWFAGTLLTEFPDATGKWAAAPLPKDKRCATTIAGDHLVIFKASKHPEAAYKWIEFLSSPENMVAYNLGTPDYPGTLLPPRTSLLEDASLYVNRPYLAGFKDQMKCAFVETADQPRYYELEQILTEKLGSAFYGEIDGATAVIEAAKEAEALLQQK
jgi:multiple sugar transport system substrate-binding protein